MGKQLDGDGREQARGDPSGRRGRSRDGRRSPFDDPVVMERVAAILRRGYRRYLEAKAAEEEETGGHERGGEAA